MGGKLSVINLLCANYQHESTNVLLYPFRSMHSTSRLLPFIHLSKSCRKTKAESEFDIEIMTPKGTGKVPRCCCVRWCGKKPFHCKHKCNGCKTVWQKSYSRKCDSETLDMAGGMKNWKYSQYAVMNPGNIKLSPLTSRYVRPPHTHTDPDTHRLISSWELDTSFICKTPQSPESPC